jgi:hypothetical protein
MNNTRRNFIRNAGVAVTAAVAGTGGVNAMTDASSLQHKLGLLEDSNAIRALQQRYFALVQQQDAAALATLFADRVVDVHAARVLDARLDNASIEVASDRQSATAQLQTRIQLGTPMSGNDTLQQMARLQGLSEQQWRESGVYTAQYVKRGSEWKISSLHYHKA